MPMKVGQLKWSKEGNGGQREEWYATDDWLVRGLGRSGV